MDYFILSQDKRYLRTPFFQDFNGLIWRKNLTTSGSQKIPDVNSLFANSEQEQDLIDILDGQLFLVSNIVKQVFLLYETSIRFKMFCVLNQLRNEVGEYYAPIFRDVDCISDESQFNLDKSFIKKLVLKKEMLKNYAIFRVAGLRCDIIIIRLDVAESLLRRKIRGMKLQRVEVK